MGRSQEKLKRVEAELKSAVPLVQTRLVVADFINAYKEGFAEEIHRQVSGLDVSVLINNAGLGDGIGQFHLVSNGAIIRLVMTNSPAHALITRVFLPQLTVRKPKSAIINTSSFGATMPISYCTVYSSTKVFHDFLSRGLNYEHPHMDIISVKPSTICTNMTHNPDPSFVNLTVDEYVKVVLGQVGWVNHSQGSWKHALLGRILSFIPEAKRASIWKKWFEDVRKRSEEVNK